MVIVTPLPMTTSVLIVDDNVNNLRAMEALLSDLGAELVFAQSGREALRELLHRDFAAILLDVQMPDLDGFETARLIRTRDRSRCTPILFVTAFHRTEQNVLQGYSLGAVDFLFKPVIPEVLTSKLGVFLELHAKTLEMQQQAELLRQAQEREHARALEDQRTRFEQSRLREEAERERLLKEALEHRAEELSRVVKEKDAAQQLLQETVQRLEQLAEERARLVGDLREEDRRKDEFLAMLAHELRNPLAPIATALDLFRLRWGDDADPVLARALGAAERQVRHMTRLVDDLLDVSRISRGAVELRRARVPLRSVVEQAVEATEPLLLAKQHELSLSLSDEELAIEADPARMVQVLANLLQNAGKYTEPRGHIRLETRRDDDEVVITVTDDGIGVRPEMLDSIFDVFVQEEPSADRSQGGLGLGLTLVKRLVHLHGGAVSASSAGRGKGSAFSVRLPLAIGRVDHPLPMPARALRAAALSVPPLRILVVDDNIDVRSTTRDLLELLGHDVDEAEDGHAALERVELRVPDLVLMDIGLPGLDGYTVAKKLRERHVTDALRLVAVTGYGDVADKNRALAAGFDGHLVKPVSAAQLTELLQNFFAAANTPDSLPDSHPEMTPHVRPRLA